jgi:multicomponent Na+:H+ antiporter subunit D
MVAGAIIVRVGESSLKRLGGLGQRMPVTFGAFLVAALAISGVPPFSGFVSKGLVVKAAEAAGGEALWGALLLGSVGTVLSFAKFGYYAFVRAAPAGAPRSLAPSCPTLRAALIAVAVPCLALGLLPGAFLGAMPGDPGSFAPYAPSELAKALGATAAGVVAFAALRGPLSRVPGRDVDDMLTPLGARVATGAARAAAAGGLVVSATSAALSSCLTAIVEDAAPPPRDTTTALLALVATTGAVLLVAALGGFQ